MKRLSFSYQAIREALSLCWRNKYLWTYVLIFFLVSVLAFAIQFFGFKGQLSAMNTVQLVPFVKQLANLFVINFISLIIIVALFIRVYALFDNKKMTFVSSFSFSRSLWSKMFLWTCIAIAQELLGMYWKVERGFNITYKSGGGLTFQMNYSQLLLWLLRMTIFVMWSLAVYYVVAILVKKNKSFWEAIKESVSLTWKRLLITILTRIFMLLVWVLFIGVLLACVGVITWLVALVFSLPFGLSWMKPFLIIVAIPAAILIPFLATCSIILSPVLYTKLMKMR